MTSSGSSSLPGPQVTPNVPNKSAGAQQVVAQQLQTLEMEFRKGLHATLDRGPQQLLPELQVAFPSRPQLMRLSHSNALYLSGSQPGNDAGDARREPERNRRNMSVRPGSVP